MAYRSCSRNPSQCARSTLPSCSLPMSAPSWWLCERFCLGQFQPPSATRPTAVSPSRGSEPFGRVLPFPSKSTIAQCSSRCCRFRAIPDDTPRRASAVQDCGLDMFKIGRPQDGFGFLAIDSAARLLLHGLWPPCHKTMIGRPPFCFVLLARHPFDDTTGSPSFAEQDFRFLLVVEFGMPLSNP